MPAYQVQQSTTAFPLVFLLVQSSDHITGLTGASPTVTLSKSGAAFASPSGAVTEIGSGWYKVVGNATDSATLGPLALHATAASADPCDALYEVVAINPQSTAYGLVLAKTTNITGFNDIAASAVVSSGAITTSGGAVSTVTTVGTLTTYTGNTPQTGDAYARLGAPAGATVSADIAAIKANCVTIIAGVTVTTNNDKTGYSVLLTQVLGAARALDSIADTSLTVNDALYCAVAAVTAQMDASGGTTLVIKTASTGTTLRTKTLTLINPPATVPDKAV